VEIQASHARVASPEETSGIGLDPRKQSISARSIAHDGARYVLVEWAKTVARDAVRNADLYGYESALAEAAFRVGPFGVAVRLERTERPEEDRLSEPFRTPRPSTDLSINGITQWSTATLHIAAPDVTRGRLSGVPFVEGTVLSAAARYPLSPFTPQRLYGTTHLTMVTAGLRVTVGGTHARMGRYGVANTSGPAIGSMSPGSVMHQH
jgi:hypothetical protein